MNAAWHRTHRLPAGAPKDVRLAWHLAHERLCGCRPMPGALRAFDFVRTHGTLRTFLDGRDSRSLAESAAAHAVIMESPPRIAVLAVLASHVNWTVSMRALDLLEKFARTHRSWVEPHRNVFLRAARSEHWLIRLQVVRALPLFLWQGREYGAVVRVLTAGVDDPQTFVRAWSLDGLATLALRQPALRARVARGLAACERSDRPSLQARARQIRRRLERARPLPPRRAHF